MKLSKLALGIALLVASCGDYRDALVDRGQTDKHDEDLEPEDDGQEDTSWSDVPDEYDSGYEDEPDYDDNMDDNYEWETAPDDEPLEEMFEATLKTGDQLDLAPMVDRSIERMVALASYQLRKIGHRATAKLYRDEYESRFKNRVTMMVFFRGRLGEIGDYAPMSEYLVRLDQELTRRLGPEIMEFTHLEDIRIINFTIPVTFNFESIPDEAISPAEYKKHFVPLSGVVAFWGVSISCDVATWGTGIWLVCAPAGMLAKYATINYIAPPMSYRWYEFFYPREF